MWVNLINGFRIFPGRKILYLLIPTGLLLVMSMINDRPPLQSHLPQSLAGSAGTPSFNTLQGRSLHDPPEVLNLLVRMDKGSPLRLPEQEKNLIVQYARETGREPVWMTYGSEEELKQLMDREPGAIVLTSGRSGAEQSPANLMYTTPWGMSREQVVVRDDTTSMNGIPDLTTRQVYVKMSSPAWPILNDLSASYAGMDLQIIPESLDPEIILEKASSGQYDVVIMDSLTLEVYLKKYLDLEVAFDLTDDEPLSWGVMPWADELHASLTRFLNRTHLALKPQEAYREDLYGLQERKKLRLITLPGRATYFFYDGHLAGFEYEFMKRFARDNNMRLEVVIADSHDALLDLLLEGRGDVIAAAVPAGSLGNSGQTRSTRPYNFSAPVIIGRTHDYPLLDTRDLEGRQVFLPEESPYPHELEHVRANGINFEIITAAPGLNTYETLALVARGEYDLTVTGSHRINSELDVHANLKVHFSLDEPLPHVWVVRNSDKQLLKALNDFISREYRMAFYNVLYAKYLDGPKNGMYPEGGLAAVNRLSPYDEIVHEYAELFGFDWRLIIAQMYMESQFNPDALSDSGAQGLMQLLPETADLLGIDDPSDPGLNIYGGIRYLDYLRQRFGDELSPEDRTWFTLAAYNAGYKRVQRARHLAASMGLDADRWFNHVEKAMLTLSQPYDRDGELVRYCRCGQTANYVREIKILYNNYVRLIRPEGAPVPAGPEQSGG